MQSSPSPTTSQPIRQRFVEDAYNEREHAILKCLREKDPDDDVLSMEDLAARAGLPVDETDRTLKVLIRRRLASIVTITNHDRRPILAIKPARIEKHTF